MYFITIPADKEEYKERLMKVGTDETGWINYLLDSQTGVEWIEYYPYQEDRAPSILKRADLPDDLKELMEVCLGSYDIEDWRGLGAELSSGKYQVEEIANILKENAYLWHSSALKELNKSFRPMDNRNIVGMKIEEVEKSYREYISSIQEIDKLLNG